MESSKERLVLFLKLRGLSQGKFEKMAGLSNGYVNKIKANLTSNTVQRIVGAFPDLNPNWLMYGEGEMLKPTNNATANNSPHAIVNAGGSVSIVGRTPNAFGDSPEEEGRWSPVIPGNVAKMTEVDAFEYLSAPKMCGSVERLYSGRSQVDVWLQMSDRSLEPYILQGDYLGLRAYPKGTCNIFPGDVYAIDTRMDGMKVRVIKNGSTPDTLMACSYNKQDYPDHEIPKSEIIRVYKKVLMFRY